MSKMTTPEHTSTHTRKIIGATIMALLLIAVAVAAYDNQLPDHGTPDGLWAETGYASSQPNSCDAAAGEICKEWCNIDAITNQVSGSGELCCVVGQTCASSLR